MRLSSFGRFSEDNMQAVALHVYKTNVLHPVMLA